MPPFDALSAAPILLLLAACAAAATYAVLPPLMPLLRRYALARPNARSSHKQPTPQGGGAAVVGVALGLLAIVTALAPVAPPSERASLLALIAAAAVLAVLGAIDDVRPLPAAPRFLIQAVAVAGAVLAVPSEIRVVPELLPWGVERALVVFAGLWFVNLTNFMDGLDWITAAELVPVNAALAGLAALGALPAAGGIVAACVAGAMLGFAPLNRPVARLFLGDVGSLPLGLLTGYALYRLAGAGHVLPALILPLYYLADATITLLRRMAKGERFWDAHRSHFYQRATVNGLTVMGVVTRVFIVNLSLAGVAIIATVAFTPARGMLAAALAALCVAALMADFSQPRGAPPKGRV
jgi:UDP-N-acetylmuramyl pentapeptide phosphotransferase/UDP-N-acetylglucosamine-1-phosphate transferase